MGYGIWFELPSPNEHKILPDGRHLVCDRREKGDRLLFWGRWAAYGLAFPLTPLVGMWKPRFSRTT